MKKSVLMVCLGNICRSPIAEASFKEKVRQAGDDEIWEIDSAGIGGWHAGRNPDQRALNIMKKHNLPPYTQKARQITKDDFKKFDYIFGMDNENISDLRERAPTDSKARILLLGDFDPQGEKIIRDPYYDSGSEGFEKCYQQCMRSCDGFLNKVKSGEI